MARGRQGGFTLTELLVVVAMIGVLAGLAAVMLDPRPRSDDAAQTMAAMTREASRKAVERGAVRDNVAAAADTGTARTQIRLSQTDGQITITVDMMVEDETLTASTGTMVPISSRTLSRGVSIEGWTARAVLDDGGAAEEALGDGEEIVILCHPEGLCDGTTVYFRARGSSRARTAILPLGGSPMTFKSW